MNMEDLLVLAIRALLSVFLSALLAMVCYFAGWLVAYSFLGLTPTSVTVSAIVSISVGAALGGYLVWQAPVSAVYWHAAYAALVFLGTVGGAAGGYWRGRGEYHMGGLPGIPELSGMFTGAILAASIMGIAVRYGPALVSALRRQRAGAR